MGKVFRHCGIHIESEDPQGGEFLVVAETDPLTNKRW